MKLDHILLNEDGLSLDMLSSIHKAVLKKLLNNPNDDGSGTQISYDSLTPSEQKFADQLKDYGLVDEFGALTDQGISAATQIAGSSQGMPNVANKPSMNPEDVLGTDGSDFDPSHRELRF